MIDTSKHNEIFDPSVFNSQYSVAIIGLGSLGSAVALNLVKLGIENFYFIDGDIVEIHNISNQVLYTNGDIGEFKAKAAKNKLSLFNTNLMLKSQAVSEFYSDKEKQKLKVPYVFCCVDSMKARKHIFNNQILRNFSTEGYFEGRIGAFGGQLLSFNPMSPNAVNSYKEELYDDDVVLPDTGKCGITLSMISTAQMAASIMVWMFIQHVNRNVTTNEVIFSVKPWMMISRLFETE